MIDNAFNEGNQHSDAEVASNAYTRSKTTGQRNDMAAKPASLKDTLNNTIDINTCCMCFGNYEEEVLDGNGSDWINCACGRWLHLECAEDCITDRHGKEITVPTALMV